MIIKIRYACGTAQHKGHNYNKFNITRLYSSLSNKLIQTKDEYNLVSDKIFEEDIPLILSK